MSGYLTDALVWIIMGAVVGVGLRPLVDRISGR